MTPSSLLAALRARGFTLSLSPAGKPQVAPFSQLTPADLEALKAHRAELIELLIDEWARTCPPAFGPLVLSSLGRMVSESVNIEDYP